uniref:Si:ch1073-70f20.1 n=1 Tax=Sinocyclocheilus anshuiensis TaxID=1608454 RepID=A0A671QW82_9TELE
MHFLKQNITSSSQQLNAIIQTTENKCIDLIYPPFFLLDIIGWAKYDVTLSVNDRRFAAASCEHNSRVFDIGEAWINDECFQCVCFEPFGVGCCEHGKQPVDYPSWCEAIRKPDSCTVAVVMKANHKLPCLFGRKNRLWKSENDPLF